MDAIVLVGGQGTRLRPLTATRHKSLVPLLNRPAIEFLFDWLRRSGFRRAVLALGQNNDDLAAAYPPGVYDGLELVLVQEHARLESGGAIRNAVTEAGVEGRFTVLNGDVFVDFDFAAALRSHERLGADLTLALYEVPDPSSFGVAVVGAEGLVTGFVEKPPPGQAPGNLVNAGVWIFEPELVAEIPPGPVRVEETLFPSLVARRRRVLGYQFQGVWADIGTPARYLALHNALLADGRNVVDDSASIEAGARLNGTAVGAGSVISASASVSGSILWESVAIGAGANVTGSIIADGSVIGAGATITGAVIGSGAIIPAGASLPPGTSLEAKARYHAGDDR
ncbi:MAG: mannose-1-phosphate guanylyltransferase [Anaerolinea sp.]|nr:mannose-1-phosphate guanylyltransferase [Anaerolinea sp.]